jgi:MraZ protein
VLFRGEHPINLDAKGRMAMPARVRRVIEDHCQGEMVVTSDADRKFLVVYPLNEYEVIERKVAALSSFHPANIKLKNTFIGYAHEVNLDSSGRILVPQSLRSLVKLEKKVILRGQANKLELWNEDDWHKSMNDLLDQHFEVEELPDELKNLSL